ncbi:MAG: tetratricopeptide repeat protein [Pseudomonadota bacterium]
MREQTAIIRQQLAAAAFTIAVACAISFPTPPTAMAETSSWTKRAPVSPKRPQTRLRRGTVPGTKAKPTQRATEVTVAGPTTTKGVRASTLGPPTAAPSGEDAAYIAFEQGQYLTALRLAEAAAKRGDASALALIGRLHADGLGVGRDLKRAKASFEKAAAAGNAEAAFGLAMMFATGDGVKKDPSRAANLFEQAARKGHAFAHYNLALAFLSGRGKPENPARAALHLRYAADRNIANAQYDLATLYQTGHGVAADAYQAAYWLRAAAQSGMTVAEYEYAVALLQGRGINSDKPDILRYLKSAAKKGVPGAQNRLAHLLLEGRLVRADPIEAMKWRLIARQRGIEDVKLDTKLQALPAQARQQAAEAANAFSSQAALGALSQP